MKKGLIYHLIFSLLITTITIQPGSLPTITIADLKEYYASFHRGAKCFFQRKKCNEKDQRALRIGSAGILATLLAIVGYTQKGRIARLFTERPIKPLEIKRVDEPVQKIVTPVIRDVSEGITEHPMMYAIKTGNVEQVRKLSKNPDNLNIRLKHISLPSSAASYVLKYPREPQRLEIYEIIIKNNAPDYNNDWQNRLNKFNENLLERSLEYRETNKEFLETLEKLTKIWTEYKRS